MNKDFKIGIIVADIDEYKPFVKEIEKYCPQKYDYFKNEGVKFNLQGTKVICVHCGIGKVNAAAAAAVLSKECDLILWIVLPVVNGNYPKMHMRFPRK